jgi:hypothetical protein
MKLLISLSLAAILVSCRDGASDDITGTYTTYFEHEFAKVYDTLIVSRVKAKGVYKIERFSGIQRIRDGSLLPKKMESELWLADYDGKSVLRLHYKEREYLYDAENKAIVLGNAIYKKL